MAYDYFQKGEILKAVNFIHSPCEVYPFNSILFIMHLQ